MDASLAADAVVVLTEWEEFRTIDPLRLRETMRGRVIVDLRNVFDPQAMQLAGFAHESIGRGLGRPGRRGRDRLAA